MKEQNELLVWVDIETTGLDSNFEVPLEIGVVVTDLDGVVHAVRSSLILDLNWATKMANADTIVQDMHQASGLWQDVQDAAADHNNYRLLHPTKIDELFTNWLMIHLGMLHGVHPLCGATINFDRAFLEKHFPNLFEFFHYSNIDVSTLKTLCERLNPEMYEKKATIKGTHRVLTDIQASIDEFNFYKHNFLWVTR